MKEPNKVYCDVSKVSVREINRATAKKMIVEKHYTHTWTMCRAALGVYYKADNNDSIFGDDKLIGCIVYGHPVGARAATSVCRDSPREGTLELTRLYVDDTINGEPIGANIESYVIAQSFKWLKQHMPEIKLLLSYADVGQEHLGAIYKATNWLYFGLSSDIALMDNWAVSLVPEPYDWVHSRTVFSRWGSQNLEHLQRVLGKEGYTEFWRRIEPPKHRYAYILANKKEKKEMMKQLVHPERPYPTGSEWTPTIKHFQTIPPESELTTTFW